MNPFLPLTEYVPDGEPHVFGDRVYLYGSHDEPSGKRFCTRDYTVWSAPVQDLSRWTCHGVTYRKAQDPRSKPGKEVDFYAPDCTQGPDGRYYLYYFAAGPNTKPFGPMSVAVADRPEGPGRDGRTALLGRRHRIGAALGRSASEDLRRPLRTCVQRLYARDG